MVSPGRTLGREKRAISPAKVNVVTQCAVLSLMMRKENSPEGAFAVGDSVEEIGSGLLGIIVRRGEFPGEWRLQLASGLEIGCLESNLVRTVRPLSPPR